MGLDPYDAEHGCDWRACPARAVVLIQFIIGKLQFCSHHRNESGITKETKGYVVERDLPGADALGAPPYQAPKARKILPSRPQRRGE